MVEKNKLLILNENEIKSVLENNEHISINIIKMAYLAHEKGESVLPHSSFLRFPNNQENRIIALPAYVGGEINSSGIKWISSFPPNISYGLDRASAVLILNSMETGFVEAILESAVISAVRTAASATLSTMYLYPDKQLNELGIIGCGPINYYILKYMLSVWSDINTVYLFDKDNERALHFKNKCKNLKIEIIILHNINDVFLKTDILSFATTAIHPHIFDIPENGNEKLILHVSLRDLSPEIILKSNNIVDDVDHVCKAQTSIHLAEQSTGNRNLINTTLGQILLGRAPVLNNRHTIFSPFGLGVLDIALGKYVYNLAIENNIGTHIENFRNSIW